MSEKDSNKAKTLFLSPLTITCDFCVKWTQANIFVQCVRAICTAQPAACVFVELNVPAGCSKNEFNFYFIDKKIRSDFV